MLLFILEKGGFNNYLFIKRNVKKGGTNHEKNNASNSAGFGT
jgi:hypothetical protein